MTPEGRPRDASISHAIVQTALRRMESGGYSTLTVDGIVTEVGTTRQTFYRRYHSVAALALEVIQRRFSTQEPVDTGGLETDLLMIQRRDLAMMSSTLIQHNLPGLLADFRTDQLVRQRYFDTIVTPKKHTMRVVLDRAQARGEITSRDHDLGFLCDLLFGPILARAILPSDFSLDDRLARDTVAVAMHAIQPFPDQRAAPLT